MNWLFSRPAVQQPAYVISPTPAAPTRSWGSFFVTLAGGIFLLWIGILFYNYIRTWNGKPGVNLNLGSGATSSGDKTPTPVDGKTRTVIAAGDAPATGGADWGVQYWMYISDWNYKFGLDKDVMKRVAPEAAAVMAPRISLSPSENTLNVRLSIFPADGAAGAANPSSNSSTGDSFTCSVENVPLQSWFSVSVTVFQRNMDIYINGRLVKSCVLPGVPKPAVGDIVLGDTGGFSGSICNLNWYNSMLTPEDCKAFHAKGTQCAPPAAAAPTPVDKDSAMVSLFGYTFRFSTLRKDGTELSSYTL